MFDRGFHILLVTCGTLPREVLAIDPFEESDGKRDGEEMTTRASAIIQFCRGNLGVRTSLQGVVRHRNKM